MNSLQQAVAARRAAETGAPPDAVAPDQAPRTLRVETKGCECWLLCWAQFVSAHYQGTRESETLLLRFAEHEVAVTGHRLGRLLPEVASFRLECLRTELRPAAALAKGDDPVIARLEIRSLSRFLGAATGEADIDQ